MISCKKLTIDSDRSIVSNLWQLYMHDLSEFRGSILQPNGRYRDDRLLTYLEYEDHWAYLIRSDDEVAGFALVRKSNLETSLMGEFFIMRKFRRLGIGGKVVASLLSEFPGNWEIPFQNENPKAALFWRRTIRELGYNAVETLIPVEGKPDLPHDVWLRFTS